MTQTINNGQNNNNKNKNKIMMYLIKIINQIFKTNNT